MWMRKLFIRGSLQLRLFSIFLLLILPLLMTGTVIIQWNNRQLRREIEGRAEANAQYTLNTLSNDLETIQSQLNFLINGPDISVKSFAINHSGMKSHEYWSAIRSLTRTLKTTAYSCKLIKDLQLYYPDASVIVSISQGFSKIDHQSLNVLLTQFQNLHLTQKDDQLFIGLMFPQTAYHTSPKDTKKWPAVFLQAILNEEQIGQTLSTLQIDNEHETFLLDTEQKTILYGSHALNTSDELGQFLSSHIADGMVFPSQVTLNGMTYSLFYSENTSSHLALVYLVPIGKLTSVNRIAERLLALYIALCIPLTFVYTLIIRRSVTEPVSLLVHAFNQVKQGNLSHQIDRHSPIHEFQSTIYGFNEMTMRLNHLVKKIYEQHILNEQMEFKQLQTQINPHFLYNNLFILKHMIKEEDTDAAVLLADHMGEYFEYITRTGNDLVPFSDEYRQAQRYLYIQQLRFGNRIKMEMDSLPQEVAGLLVPKLILQPLIENALIHGVESLTAGVICIRFFLQGAMLFVVVEDNGSGLSEDEFEALNHKFKSSSQETTGLINIHRRLHLAFHSQAGLQLEHSELGGLKVIMSLPFDSKEENHAALSSTDCG